MSLLKSIGNFIKGPAADLVKGVIPGKFDDVIIDAVLKKESIEKVKEGFFPSKGDAEGGPSAPLSFLTMREKESEVGARRDISRIERLTGETQSRWTRFMTASIMQKFSEGNAVTSTPSSAVTKVRPTRSAKARMST